METCQDIDTGRHTGTHQEPHTNTQVSRGTQLTDTSMPSDMDTKADWGIHRYADAQRRSHMQTQPHVQMQTYPQRQAPLFLEQNPGNLPISPIPQMIDLIYPPIHCPPIYLAIHSALPASHPPSIPIHYHPCRPTVCQKETKKTFQELNLGPFPLASRAGGWGIAPPGPSSSPDSYASYPP